MSSNPIESHIASLEGSYQQISARLDSLDHRLDGLDHRLDTASSDLRSELTALRTDQSRQFQWVVGLVIASVISPIVLHLLH